MADRTAVGLDIGTTGVRAAELRLGKSAITLQRFGQVALPPDAVSDGEVADTQAVAAALRRLWSEVKFSTKRVVLGVANQKVVVRQIDLPWMETEELKSALAFQVQDYIPIPVDEAILDFHPVEEFFSDSGNRMLRVLVVAAARETVGNVIAAVEKAGLKPTMIDLTSFAVIRALAELDHIGASTEADAVVDVGARVTNIAVHQGGVPRFVRILQMGGGDLTDALAERMGVAAEEADAFKHGLGTEDSVATDSHPGYRALEPVVKSFVEEIRGSIDYYLASPDAVPIRRVLISGGGSQLAGLAQRLGAATRLPVESASPLSALRVGKTGLSPDQLKLIEPIATVPVGLALGVAS